MRILLLPFSARFVVYTGALVVTAFLLFEFLAGFTEFFVWVPLLLFGALAVIGTVDLIQTRHAVLRNYPLSAHIRFILEEIRPEIRQYLLESDSDALPFSRAQRSLVYSRAKNESADKPFGTLIDVYQSGFEFIGHSMRPAPLI